MAEPGSNLTRKDETVRGAIEGLRKIPHTIAKGVKRVGRAVTEVTDGMVSLVSNPPENPGAFSTAPPRKGSEEGLDPIERTDEYEKAHPFAPYALSKRDKNTILQKQLVSSQLDMRSLNTVRIFTGIEMYNLSVRLDTDTSMYNTSPIRDREEEVFINSSPEVVKKAPEIIMTLTDFNHKYLKWMHGEGTDTPDNIKKRKRDLKNLFKFVFNNSKLNDLTTSFVKKLQRIAHTPLDTEDKLPCQDSPLYEDFKKSLEYRLPEAKKEMEVALATFGEMNSYAQQKIILYDGINDLVRLMQGGYSRGCIKYQYGNKSDYRVVMDLAEQNRIMRLFIQFIKKQESGYMNSGTLQQSLKDKDKYRVLDSDGREGRFNELYNELTGILESMRTPSSSEEIESLKGQLKEKELAILALESLLQISIQITHLNEGSLELEERYQRVETKMESEKLFQQYEKFRGLLGGLRLNASMQDLIDCGEQLAGIMIQYSGRKDISSDERDDATERLIDVNRVLHRYKNKMDYNTVYNGLSGLYEDIERMIEKKYRASASASSPLNTPNSATSATNAMQESADTLSPDPLSPATQPQPQAQAQAPCTFFNNTQVIRRPLTQADNTLLGSRNYNAINIWVNTKVNELSLLGTHSTERKETTPVSIIKPNEYDETLVFSNFERMISSSNNQDCLIHSLLTSLSGAFRQLNKTGKDCIATYFRLYIMVPIVDESTTIPEEKKRYIADLKEKGLPLDVNLAEIFGKKFNISIFVRDRDEFGWLYLAKAPKILPDREVIVIYNPGAGHFEAVRDSRNNQYIFPYKLVESWDKKKNTMGMTENQAKCKFTYSGAHLRLKSKTAEKFKVLFSENTADQKACKHVYILPEEHYGKIKDINEKIRQVSFVMGYYEDVTKDMVSENKEIAFQDRKQWINGLFPGTNLKDLTFANITELMNINDTQHLYEYDPTKYDQQPDDYKKSFTEGLNISNHKRLQFGGSKPTPQQKLQAIFDIESNSDTKNYCDTVLTLLLIDMKRKMYDFDANKFMKKLGTSLGKTKPCPVVFHILKVILDEGMKQVIDSNAYIFSPQKPLDYTEDTFQNLEQRYAETFDDSEKEAFENMTPIRYYHRTPEQFRDLLGDSPYILSGHSDDTEPELRGVDVDGLYDEPLRMTADEKNLLTCGGIPMGAIIFMYITAVANNKRSDLLKSLQSDPLLE